MKISIAGDLGSGKSTVAKNLSEQLGFAYLSTGQLHRNIAQEYGVKTLELNEIASRDETIDRRIDSYLTSLNGSSEDLIIDSRLAWHFVKDTFKIYLEVHSDIGAERVLGDSERTGEPIYKNRESAIANLKVRKNAENQRFFDKYGVRCDDLSNYHIVINTSDSSVESTGALILRLFKAWSNQASYQRLWISPRFLVPTEHVRSLAREEAHFTNSEIGKYGYKDEFPIECARYDDYYFIWDGHRRASGALFNKVDFVPVSMIAMDDQEIHKNHTAAEFAKSVFKLSWLYDWEDVHGFHFIKYPELAPPSPEHTLSDAV